MFRLVLLLLAFGALALFVFQNLSPVLPLVVLGVPTIALPVGLWVLGAIAAGAFTSILIAALTRLAAPRFSHSSSRRPAPAAPTNGGKTPSSSSGAAWKAPAWAANWANVQDKQRATTPTNRPQARRSAAEDWEQPAHRDDWDDWEVASPAASTSPPPRTAPLAPASFAEDNPFQLPDEEPIYQDMPPEEPTDQEQEVWDDWEEETPPATRREEPPPPPQRDFVEIRRTPQTQSRSGTVYSYTYRKEDEEEPAQEQVPPPKSDRVVDAEFRVITPPYRPDASLPETSDDELEEWDDWEYEPEKPADEPDEPYQNPPLNLGNAPRRGGE